MSSLSPSSSVGHANEPSVDRQHTRGSDLDLLLHLISPAALPHRRGGSTPRPKLSSRQHDEAAALIADVVADVLHLLLRHLERGDVGQDEAVVLLQPHVFGILSALPPSLQCCERKPRQAWPGRGPSREQHCGAAHPGCRAAVFSSMVSPSTSSAAGDVIRSARATGGSVQFLPARRTTCEPRTPVAGRAERPAPPLAPGHHLAEGLAELHLLGSTIDSPHFLRERSAAAARSDSRRVLGRLATRARLPMFWSSVRSTSDWPAGRRGGQPSFRPCGDWCPRPGTGPGPLDLRGRACGWPPSPPPEHHHAAGARLHRGDAGPKRYPLSRCAGSTLSDTSSRT